MTRLDTGEPISGDVTIAAGRGFAAEVVIIPQKELPETFAERGVNPPMKWETALVVYRAGSDRSDPEAAILPCTPLEPPGTKPAPRPLGGMGWQRSLFGYKHPPRLKGRWKEGELRMWTFFAAPGVEPGDHVYELTLFPTLIQFSSVRFETGPPVILQQGRLTVTEAVGRD
jgi:hypothetical protein